MVYALVRNNDFVPEREGLGQARLLGKQPEMGVGIEYQLPDGSAFRNTDTRPVNREMTISKRSESAMAEESFLPVKAE